MSKYDNINTARDLVMEVIENGLNREVDAIYKATDILEKTPVEDMVELANDKREVSSGRTIGEVFYSVAFNLWPWDRALKFYNTYTNLSYRQVCELRDDLRDIKQHNQFLKSEVHNLTEWKLHNNSKYVSTFAEVEALKRENLTLKAKLYDLITETKN